MGKEFTKFPCHECLLAIMGKCEGSCEKLEKFLKPDTVPQRELPIAEPFKHLSEIGDLYYSHMIEAHTSSSTGLNFPCLNDDEKDLLYLNHFRKGEFSPKELAERFKLKDEKALDNKIQRTKKKLKEWRKKDFLL